MKSPYWNTNVGQGWGPQGSAIQQMLARDWQSSKEGFDALGKMGGAIGGGVVGGFQGHADPGVFGQGTTPGQGATKGFLQNFNSIYNGGSGGDASGIGALMGGSGGQRTPNFKQLQQGGKAADSFREMIKIGMPLAGEQEPNVFGTDDEWKTLSATEKFARVGEAFKAQQFQAAQQAYKQGLQDYAARAKQIEAAKQGMKANEQIAPWLQSYAEAADQPVPAITTPGPFGGPVAPAMNVGAPPMQAAAAASRKYPLAPTAPQFDNTLSALTRAAQLSGSDPLEGGPPQILPGPFPNTRIVTDARGRSTPQVVREDKAAEGYIEVPDPSDPVYGPKIKLPLSQAMKDYPHLLERLKPGGGSSSPDGAQADVTEADYKRLKKGEKYWWKGKQLTKQ